MHKQAKINFSIIYDVVLVEFVRNLYVKNKNLVKTRIKYYMVQERRLELPRAYAHYPLKVVRLPIPPSLQINHLQT